MGQTSFQNSKSSELGAVRALLMQLHGRIVERSVQVFAAPASLSTDST
jgi:hypothetical protein